MTRGNENPEQDRLPLSFSTWKEALASAPLTDETKRDFTREILGFLRHCKVNHAPATVMLVRKYLAEGQKQGGIRAESAGANGVTRLALRWFFGEGRKAEEKPGGAPGRRVESGAKAPQSKGRRIDRAEAGGDARAPRRAPPVAARDLGGADWERDLIKAVRTAGLLWRTEETYRGWAARFAKFLAPRSPYVAEAAEVGAFLSMLAVERRASQSTQKQALRVNGFANAVV